jgi:chemotaxis signal transduction protein
MANLELMKLVFQLGAVRFSLPVDHLVEIRQGSSGWIDRSQGDAAHAHLGTINQRDGFLKVYDLGRLLQLPHWTERGDMHLLVLTGLRGPWAIPVNAVVGIFPFEAFSALTVSPLLEHVSQLPGLKFECWQDEVLVCGDAGRWEQMRG